jgi:predicted ATPase
VAPIAEQDLQRTLARLSEAELLHARGLAPAITYRFKHALVRDVAYESLLKSRRKELHRRVAQTIDQSPALKLKDTHPEMLTHHWTGAGETELAIGQWAKAGKAAEVRNAFHEAQGNYLQALALPNLLPESAERDARELQFRQSLVFTAQLTRGWAAPDTIAAAKRLGMLAERSGNLGLLIASIIIRCFHAYIAGEVLLASALADQALQLALRERNPTALAHLHMMQLLIRHERGDLARAEEYFTTGLEFF